MFLGQRVEAKRLAALERQTVDAVRKSITARGQGDFREKSGRYQFYECSLVTSNIVVTSTKYVCVCSSYILGWVAVVQLTKKAIQTTADHDQCCPVHCKTNVQIISSGYLR